MEAYCQLQLSPVTPQGAQLYRFDPGNLDDLRARKWSLWKKVSEVGIFVKDYYLHTQYVHHANAAASGNSGQIVVKTQQGTLTWVPNDRRVSISNNSPTLRTKLSLIVEPWHPHRDLARHYHKGRLPQMVKSYLSEREAQNLQGFQ